MKTEEILEKAKTLYPVGTKFISLFGVKDIVTERKSFTGEVVDSHFISLGSVMVFGKDPMRSRMIYDNGNWAEIIKD